MLIYNQIYDLYHTIFRMLRLMENKKGSIEIEKLRILDFYLAFPAELLEINSFRGFNKYKKILKNYKNSYERVINRERLFFRISNIQTSAISELVSYGFFDAEAFKNGRVKRTNKKNSIDLEKRIIKSNEKDNELIALLNGPLSEMDLYGHIGLKARTNLIEF